MFSRQSRKIVSLLVLLVFSISLIVPLPVFAAKININYVALGDSLTAGVTPYHTISNSYSDYTAHYLSRQGLLSSYTKEYAVPGATTEDLLSLVKNNISLRDKLKTTTLISMTIGANDILNHLNVDFDKMENNFDLQKIPVILTQINHNLSETLAEIKAINPTIEIYVLGYYYPFPHLSKEIKDTLTPVVFSINEQLQQTAIEYGGKFVPIANEIVENLTAYLPNPKDVHLNLAGYNQMAQSFISTINKDARLPFHDVPATYWAYHEIRALYEDKVMTGISDDEFGVNKQITRAEAAQILYDDTLSFEQSVPANPGFKDIPENHPNYMAIAKLTNAGIFSKAEYFKPGDVLTRAQMAKIFALTFSMTDRADVQFKDISNHHWAKPYISLLVGGRFVNGYPDGTFKPNQTTSRAEFAVILVRIKHFYD